ncbi:uncharacterized protein LOC139923649 [Centroberyx gerrardi]|uniref:uncharacterized protein n=1 Tax=Centroberyx gerrardi TaxID=166262 RepID=UPI003AACFCBA
MEPFYHPPPPSSPDHLPSHDTTARMLHLQAVTSEWLSLTLEPSASAAGPSLTGTPIPPTPPPLPADLTPFLKPPEPRATPAAPPQRGFTPPPRTLSRKSTPSFKEGMLGLDRTPTALPFSQPTSPLPDPPSSSTSLLPDTSLQYDCDTELSITETTEPLYQTETESVLCIEPEPVASPTQVPQWHKSAVRVNKSSKPPKAQQQVQDPYDQLLSMILDGHTSTDDGEASRFQPQSRFRLEAKESRQPAVKLPAFAPASESASGVRLELEFHKPVTMEPLSATWEGLSKTLNKQPAESQRLPSVTGTGYPELFIEEEEEAREDKEENIRIFNERLNPQVAHAV